MSENTWRREKRIVARLAYMNIFANKEKLISRAVNFINKRTESLKKDVKHCLKEPYTPFPALLYCFSTIDFLGALYKGDATKYAKTAPQSKEYLKKFMHYTEEQSHLLMEIFRHKIVHLAQPRPVIKYNDNHIGWRYHHEKHDDHLRVVKVSKVVNDNRHEFNISITGLMKDILESVNKPQKGYLAELKNNQELQDNFKRAHAAIYEDALSQS